MKRHDQSSGLKLVAIVFAFSSILHGAEPEKKSGIDFPFKDGDRVMWVGSSSTRIGTWCRTMEFLLHTRHPNLKLDCKRETTGGGTFATGTKELSYWLEETKPTLVFFNYGGNDATGSTKGIPTFKSNMARCIEEVKNAGARVVILTHQAADVRMSGPKALADRKLYAETMIELCNSKKWPVIDTHHPLEDLQKNGETLDPEFTINRDKIHLSDSAYVAWGYYMYDLMNPPPAESAAEISAAAGKVVAASGCKISDIQKGRGWITFVRNDAVLPILPPTPIPGGSALKNNAAFTQPYPPAQLKYVQDHGSELPPKAFVPLEAHSRYMLKITGLEEGDYEFRCDDKPIAVVHSSIFEGGFNINSLLLQTNTKGPWNDLATNIFNGKDLEKIGKTSFKFSLKKQ